MSHFTPHTGFDPCCGHDTAVTPARDNPVAPCRFAPLDSVIDAMRQGYSHRGQVDLGAAIRSFLEASALLSEYRKTHGFTISERGDVLEQNELDARVLMRSAAMHHGVDLDQLARAI